MLDNLVFISGPHGAGKSTLIKKLLKKLPNSVSPELESRTPQFYWGNFTGKRNFFHRQALKYAQRAIENYEYWALAIREPGKIIIGDRCVYDGLAYRMAGIQLGWITEAESQLIENNLRILYPEELLCPRAIILNPPFEMIKSHLEKRWKETEWVKFMETDMDYLHAVCNSFKSFEGKNNILYLGEEKDMSEEDAMAILINWINKNKKG